jgi:signal transduction histidine kinase/streptogramin lyase
MDREKGTFTRYSHDPAHPEKLSRPAQRKIDERIDEWADDHITFITEDVTGSIWIGTFGNGINRYDPITKKVTHLSNTDEEIGNIKIDAPFWACASKDGVLWIGYFENLYNVDLLQTNIPYVSTGNIVYSIYEDTSEVLWYGGDFGLVRKDHLKKTEEHFVHDPNDPRSLNSTVVVSIYEDRKGVLWVGTNTGLNRFNKKDRSFTRFKSNLQINHSEPFLSIEDIYEDSWGNFWIATADEGLKRMDRQTGAVLHCPYKPNDSNSTSTKRIRRIYEDRHGNLWIGTLGGGLNRFTHNGSPQYFLYRADINDILEDFEGVLWVATSKGLYRKDQASDKFKHFVYPGTQLTSDMVISGLLEDVQKSLWMNSAIGIIELNRSRDGLVIYGESHGVNSQTSGQFAYGGCYKSQSGELFFGDGNGFYSFFPNELSRNTRPPQILIHQFRLGGEIIDPSSNGPLKKALAYTEEIRLKHDQNFFSFDFTAIHYSNPIENKHLFMLEGLDDNWHIAGDQRTAYYGKVPPGDYTFRVKASNSDGVWAEKRISVIVLPPWWQTSWAYLSYAVAFVACIWLFTWYRSRSLKAENLRLEEKVTQRTAELEHSLEEKYELNKKIESQQALLNERLRISRELHDDIGSTLGSISIYSEVAKKRTSKNENANEVLSKIGLASRELIDKMSDIVWSLNPNNESFEQLQNRMMAFTAMMLAPRNISYDFSAGEELKTIQLTGEQRKNIFLIFKEALYNIVKYANCQSVQIVLSAQKNGLAMIIRDNGKGFDISKVTNPVRHDGEYLGGNGIKNMQARADDMKATLCIDSKINEGTTVQLTLSDKYSQE